MKYKLINDAAQKTFAIILEYNDEATSCLLSFAKEANIKAAQFTAIGAFSEATLGFFDFKIKDYKKIAVQQQVEVLACTGDISVYNDEPKVHAHIVLGKEDGSAHGGHLLKGIVHPTLEVILTESPSYLERMHDEISGIPLISLEK